MTLAEFSRRTLAAPQRIVYIGNSVTAQRDGYREILHSMLSEMTSNRHQAVNLGLGGVGSFGCAALLGYFLRQRTPSLAIIETSLADSGGATPQHLINRSLSSIVSYLKQRNVEPVFLHLPRRDVSPEVSRAVRSAYDAVAGDEGISQIDVESLLVEQGIAVTSDLFTDGIHTNPHGAGLFAQAICEYLIGQEHSKHQPAGTVVHAEERTAIIDTLFVDSLQPTSQQHRHGLFRLQMQTFDLQRNESIEFKCGEEEFLGVVVVVDTDSGVMRIESGSREFSVQLADEWSNRASRIQVVPFPWGFEQDETLRIVCSESDVAPTDAAGRASSVVKLAQSLRIIGMVYTK